MNSKRNTPYTNSPITYIALLWICEQCERLGSAQKLILVSISFAWYWCCLLLSTQSKLQTKCDHLTTPIHNVQRQKRANFFCSKKKERFEKIQLTIAIHQIDFLPHWLHYLTILSGVDRLHRLIIISSISNWLESISKCDFSDLMTFPTIDAKLSTRKEIKCITL